VNQLIAPKLVQLPKVSELVDDVTSLRPKFLNICDLRSGFWQVKIRKESRPLTSFTAPSGRRYQFCVCPFRLNISPAAVLYIVTSIFAGESKTIRYFLIYGRSHERWKHVEGESDEPKGYVTDTSGKPAYLQSNKVSV